MVDFCREASRARDPYGLRSVCAAAFLAMMAPGENPVAAQDASASPAQLAAMIARTMTATKPAAAEGASITQQFSARDNVVESRLSFAKAADYAGAFASRNKVQQAMTRYLCQGERLAYVKRGVVFHDVQVGPGSAQSFEFVVDERTCASMPTSPAADPSTLAETAQRIAKGLAAALATKEPTSGARFDKVTAQGETVQIDNVIIAPAFIDYFKFKEHEIRGKTQGLFCTAFADAIRQGNRFRVFYRQSDGSPVLEILVDKSIC